MNKWLYRLMNLSSCVTNQQHKAHILGHNDTVSCFPLNEHFRTLTIHAVSAGQSNPPHVLIQGVDTKPSALSTRKLKKTASSIKPSGGTIIYCHCTLLLEPFALLMMCIFSGCWFVALRNDMQVRIDCTFCAHDNKGVRLWSCTVLQRNVWLQIIKHKPLKKNTRDTPWELSVVNIFSSILNSLDAHARAPAVYSLSHMSIKDERVCHTKPSFIIYHLSYRFASLWRLLREEVHSVLNNRPLSPRLRRQTASLKPLLDVNPLHAPFGDCLQNKQTHTRTLIPSAVKSIREK